MATEQETQDTQEEQVKVDPRLNPRNISMSEIAGTAAKERLKEVQQLPEGWEDAPQDAAPAAAEAEAPAAEEQQEEPAAEEVPAEPEATAAAAEDQPQNAIDPTKEYEVTVDGQKMKVPGQKIIDAGFRTFQKETAADYRLKTATELLKQAEERAAQMIASAPVQAQAAEKVQPTNEPTEAELGNMLQYGTPEQASQAIKFLMSRGQNQVNPMQVAQIAAAQAREALSLEEGAKFVKSEYADLLENPMARQLFFAEERRRRTPKEQGGEGDTRPHKELYQAIGDDIRKSFNMPKPASASKPAATVVATAQSRQERKAAAPSVPKTAAGRLSANEPAQKPKTIPDVIAAMRTARGQGRLTQPMKG